MNTATFRILIFSSIFQISLGYFWREDVSEYKIPPSPSPNGNVPSNLGCFMCTQLLSVTKHRVGLSENQLRNQLYEKCRVLPSVFKDQCFAFVETSLPEIYYSINYDLSSKDVCVRMNFCEETNPFAVGGPLPPIDETPTTPEYPGIEEIYERPTTEMTTTTTRRRPTTTTTATTTTTITTTTPLPTTTKEIRRVEEEESPDRIGHRNMLEVILPPHRPKYISRNSIDKSLSLENSITTTEKPEVDEKRLTCAFCERMLENAKNYAVTSKTDITSFANSACSTIPKGRNADQCYQMADKKIADLAKFVDQQVVDALWCAELNRC